MYSLARNILFKLDPEVAHDISLDAMGAAERLHLLQPFVKRMVEDPVEVMGLRFPNRVGLAAGLDKNGEYFNALGKLGFGFVEVGTVTPLAQPGNPQPRLFRLKNEQGIINRMGFNNNGVNHLVERVRRRRYQGVLGINMGKNKLTPEENALSDYQKCMEAVYTSADYIAINISSPNTPGLRNLQFGENLEILLKGIKAKQVELQQRHGKNVPVAVKIAPDMSDDELKSVADTLLKHNFDAVIATNTTISREGVEHSVFASEAGGLSGSPVRDKATHVIRTLAEHLQGKMPIIGVGGIMTGEDAAEKLQAGASLVQLYTGFIYRGPELVAEAANAVSAVAASKSP
ncbi:quinone-dependent dihydroorotate dehydrogenase [Teredinibacter franksiae]|uniref:quinone-dependent dihydroorotate dehydrogenase n=1 Tax=Teredinibacter franksiae TaxID=2761453 RepID=UPI0016257956|nr:quinone-dependent dihydroorotate dehydrogenase [Teredinibacter franksiae]